MSDYVSSMQKQHGLSEAEQRRIGKAAGNDMDQRHKNYLAIVIGMIDKKEIDLLDPQTFLTPEYQKLDQQSRDQVDLGLVNLVDQVRRIADFYYSKKTPNASPELQNMIELLWLSKNRLEDKFGDVTKL